MRCMAIMYQTSKVVEGFILGFEKFNGDVMLDDN